MCVKLFMNTKHQVYLEEDQSNLRKKYIGISCKTTVEFGFISKPQNKTFSYSMIIFVFPVFWCFIQILIE